MSLSSTAREEAEKAIRETEWSHPATVKAFRGIREEGFIAGAEWANTEAIASLARIKAARAGHPACGIHDDEDPVNCGWKQAVRDIDQALADYEKREQ